MSTHAPNRAKLQPAGRRGIIAHSQLVGFAVVLSLGIHTQSQADSIPPAERADTILIVKHERKLYLLHDNYPLRSYRMRSA